MQPQVGSWVQVSGYFGGLMTLKRGSSLYLATPRVTFSNGPQRTQPLGGCCLLTSDLDSCEFRFLILEAPFSDFPFIFFILWFYRYL